MWATVVRRREPLLVLLAVAAFALIGARWLVEFRRGMPMDIDEAGYQTFAIFHLEALDSGGLAGWVQSIMGPSIFAPLLPATTSVAYELFGVHRTLGVFVALAFGCLMLVASYGLGRAVAGVRGGWLTLAVVAATPVVISYSRSFNFAIASAAAAAVTLWAIARSDRWLSPWWSAAAGVGMAAMLLARTMTVSLVPGLVIAAVVAVATGPPRLRRTGTVIVSGVVALALAGPWYYRNGEAVYDYLTSFGYGDRRAEFGSDESLLSPHSWQAMSEYALMTYVGVPLAALTLACLVALAVTVLRRPRGPDGSRLLRWLRSPLLPSLLFAGWGVLILTSTGNKGSGFLAPLAPAFAVLVAAAIAGQGARLRKMLTAALLAVVLLNTVASIDTGNALADGEVIDLGPLGHGTLVDGTGVFQRYVIRVLPTAPPHRGRPLTRRTQLAWVAANRRLAADLDPRELTVLGFRHALLNSNSVQLEQLLADRPTLPITMVDPLGTPDEASLTAWLGTGSAATACELLVAPGTSLEFEPRPDQAALLGAARTTGFAPTGQTWRLPDGRLVTRWHRESCA